jgi:hypothetical protein
MKRQTSNNLAMDLEVSHNERLLIKMVHFIEIFKNGSI